MKIVRIFFILLGIALIFGAVPGLVEAKGWACTAKQYTDDKCSGSPFNPVLTCQDSDKTVSCTKIGNTHYNAICTECGDAGCNEDTKKCNVQPTAPSISLSTDFTQVPADASTAVIITASTSDSKSGVLMLFGSDVSLYYSDSDGPSKSATCTTGNDGMCSISIKSSTAGKAKITAKATTQTFEYVDGSIEITFDPKPSSSDEYLTGSIEFSPSSPQVNEEVTARSAFGTIYNKKVFLLKEGTCETGIVRGDGCTVKDGKCSATFRPNNAKTYDLRFCDEKIDTKHTGTLTVGSLVTLKIIWTEPISKIVTLTDKLDFLTTFPDWPGDTFKITIQYSTDGGAQFKNLKNWEGKEIGGYAFARNGKTITASIVVADNDLKDIGGYLFRVVPTQVGGGVPSNVASIKFEAKCKRGNPTIEFKSEPAPIKVPFGKEVNPDKLEFKFHVKNNDEAKCKLFDPPFSDFGVKIKDFCIFKPDKKEGEKDNCGFDLNKVTLTPAKRQAGPQEKSLMEFTLTVDIGPQSYPSISPTKTFYINLEAEHLNIEEIWKQKANIDGKGEGKAVIKVERGGRECKRDFPLVYVKDAGGRGKERGSPGDEVVLPGETLTFEAFVFNTDFAECGPSTFKFDSTGLSPSEKEEKGRWEFAPLLHVLVPSQIKPADIEYRKDDVEFTIEGCPEGKQLNECPYKSFKFNLKSDPETKPGVRKDFRICFENVNSHLTNCRLPDEKFKNKFGELNTVYNNWDSMALSLPSRIHVRHGGSCGSQIIKDNPKENCEFLVSVLPNEDKVDPKIDVKLSPEKPYPGGKVKFLITTSDNVQMKQIKLAIDKGFIKDDIPLKDPEEHVTIHEGGPFVKREIPHNYYAIAKDWKHEEGNTIDNIACFPEQQDKTCPDPNSAKILKEFDLEDNADLVIDSIEFNPNRPEVDKTLAIRVDVKNLGNVDVKDVVGVRLEAFRPSSSTPIEIRDKKTDIVAKGQYRFGFTSDKLDVDGIWVIKAIAYTLFDEADKTNNEFARYMVVKPKVGAGETKKEAKKETIGISGSCTLDRDPCEITVTGACTQGKLSVATGEPFDTKNVVCQPPIRQGKATIKWGDCSGKSALANKKIIARATDCVEGQSNDLNVLTGTVADIPKGVTPKGKKISVGSTAITFNLDSSCTGGINVKGVGFERDITLKCDSTCADPFKDITTVAPEADKDADYKCATNKCCVKEENK